VDTRPKKPGRDASRMPENSVFFDKIVPVVLIGLAVVTVVVILIAAGVLLGIVPFR
jgi:hypothetical protein